LKYRREEIQPLKQVQLITEHAAMHHTQTAEGIIDMDQGLKTSSTQKGKASPRTSTRPSYRPTSKGTDMGTKEEVKPNFRTPPR
jgi:hypothetical protein